MRYLLTTLGCLAAAMTCPAQTPNWTQIKPTTSPSARMNAPLAYDSARRRTVLFGGQGNTIFRLADTWEWDGKNWTQIKPGTSPSGRDLHAMAYDSARKRTVLFGGQAGSLLADTWEWDGKNWTQIKPATAPPARFFHAMAYDSSRRRTVLFGGINGSASLGDTWEWDGKNWTHRVACRSSRWTPAPNTAHGSTGSSAR